MQKPSYSTTKLSLWISSALAWAVIFILVVASIAGSQEAVALVPAIVPLMVGIIVALLGVHRGFGSLDMYTMSKAAKEEITATTTINVAGPSGGAE